MRRPRWVTPGVKTVEKNPKWEKCRVDKTGRIKTDRIIPMRRRPGKKQEKVQGEMNVEKKTQGEKPVTSTNGPRALKRVIVSTFEKKKTY